MSLLTIRPDFALKSSNRAVFSSFLRIIFKTRVSYIQRRTFNIRHWGIRSVTIAVRDRRRVWFFSKRKGVVKRRFRWLESRHLLSFVNSCCCSVKSVLFGRWVVFTLKVCIDYLIIYRKMSFLDVLWECFVKGIWDFSWIRMVRGEGRCGIIDIMRQERDWMYLIRCGLWNVVFSNVDKARWLFVIVISSRRCMSR